MLFVNIFKVFLVALPAHNGLVAGSSPAGPTSEISVCTDYERTPQFHFKNDSIADFKNDSIFYAADITREFRLVFSTRFCALKKPRGVYSRSPHCVRIVERHLRTFGFEDN